MAQCYSTVMAQSDDIVSRRRVTILCHGKSRHCVMAQSYNIVSRRSVTTLSWHRVTSLHHGTVTTLCQGAALDCHGTVTIMCQGAALRHCHGTVTTMCQGAALRHCHGTVTTLCQCAALRHCHGTVTTLCQGAALRHCNGTVTTVSRRSVTTLSWHRVWTLSGAVLRHCVMARSYGIMSWHRVKVLFWPMFPATDDNHDTQRTASCRSELEYDQWLWHYSTSTCRTQSLYTITIMLNLPLFDSSLHTSFDLHSATISEIIHTYHGAYRWLYFCITHVLTTGYSVNYYSQKLHLLQHAANLTAPTNYYNVWSMQFPSVLCFTWFGWYKHQPACWIQRALWFNGYCNRHEIDPGSRPITRLDPYV
jgi:hypothetical protein